MKLLNKTDERWSTWNETEIVIQWSYLNETKLGEGKTVGKKMKAIYLQEDVMSGEQAPYFAIPNEM